MQSDALGLRRLVRAAAFSATLLSAACATPHEARPVPTGEQMSDAEAFISDGRDIAEAQCASCHAVGPYGDSPNANAPPFRRVLSRYHAEVLEEELIQGIRVTHPMPAFQLNPQGVDALIAYLRSVQENSPGEGKRP